VVVKKEFQQVVHGKRKQKIEVTWGYRCSGYGNGAKSKTRKKVRECENTDESKEWDMMQ
jgi:hypothetical protein